MAVPGINAFFADIENGQFAAVVITFPQLAGIDGVHVYVLLQ